MSGKDEKMHDEGKLYHEKQVKALCALHALNNLFQKKQTFTKKDLDQICERLSPGTFINPHRSMLGLGNYDVNVLMAALQERGYETIWFDKRKNVDVLEPGNIMGFILNTPSAYCFGPLKLALHCKHWIALRRLRGQYMNLDSKLSAPAAIGDQDKLLAFLRTELEDGKKELLLVVERDIYEASTWRRCDGDVEDVGEEIRDKGISNGSEVVGCVPQNEDRLCRSHADTPSDDKDKTVNCSEASRDGVFKGDKEHSQAGGDGTEDSKPCDSTSFKDTMKSGDSAAGENQRGQLKTNSCHVLHNGDLPQQSS